MHRLDVDDLDPHLVAHPYVLRQGVDRLAGPVGGSYQSLDPADAVESYDPDWVTDPSPWIPADAERLFFD
ncbi:hypothetical protein [Plantactinospora soyae]|uniref:Uncharacterized protein n=1 Tax=Plantactinospora soyae TaxID=1544732 RepID=A0A927R460_9ACTN|nr:hypothetical protein [Plantactinospora soyae]MBE1486239.1 hypothetical protein [Plantactinospora soyae]